MTNSKLLHYKGQIGEFDYDPEIWEIESTNSENKYLHFNSKKEVEELKLPEGLKSCEYMFRKCKLP